MKSAPPELAIGMLLSIPMPNGLFAAVWVLGLADPFRMGRRKVENQVVFLVLDGYWERPPTERQLANAAPAMGVPSHHERDEWKGCFWGPLPADFASRGIRAPSEAELALAREASGTMVFQNAEHLRSELFMHWRLKNDRPAVEEEWRLAEVARAVRVQERKAKLTLPEMLKEKPFQHWRQHWPLAVVREARAIFAEATEALLALEGRGTRAQKVAILKAIVTRFNALYDKTGCIETGEREEVIARLEQLAGLVGLSNEDEALTGHRDW